MSKQITITTPPVGPLLAIVFTVLKLCGVINWSWWWVLLPVWGPLALIVVLIGGVGLIEVLASKGKTK